MAARPVRDVPARGWDGEPPVCYLASVDGPGRRQAFVFYSERDNTHLGWAWLAILPEQRRRGYGSALLRAVAERGPGRRPHQHRHRRLGVRAGDSAFAAQHGLERRSQAIMRRQHLAELAPGPAAASCTTRRPPPPRTTSWSGSSAARRRRWSTPMVELVAAINDAPTDDLDIEDEVFSPERLAAYEEATIGPRQPALPAGGPAPGDRRARRAHGGRGRGAAPGARPTSTTPPSRGPTAGTGSGCCSRPGCCCWLAEAEPQLETVDTWNAESNDHMIAVNEALGYRVMGRELQFQKGLCRGSVAGGEHQRAVVGDRDGVLHVRAARPVAAAQRPAVRVGVEHVGGLQEPRLDRDHQAGLERVAAAGAAVVRARAGRRAWCGRRRGRRSRC